MYTTIVSKTKRDFFNKSNTQQVETDQHFQVHTTLQLQCKTLSFTATEIYIKIWPQKVRGLKSSAYEDYS